jgi:hypothetical protein
MTGDVYTLGVWNVKPDRHGEFIAAWQALGKIFRGLTHPPSGKGTLVQSVQNPNLFYSFGPWESVDDIQAMREDREAQNGMRALRELCFEATPGTFHIVGEA